MNFKMKKGLAILILAVVSHLSCQGQTEKGRFLTGVNASKYIGAVDSYAFNISGGIFLTKNISVGLNTQLFYSDSGGVRSSYSFSPFVKCYFLKGSTKLILQSSFGYGKSKISTFGVISQEDVNGVFFPDPVTKYRTYNVGTGVALFLNKKISLEFTTGYEAGKSSISVNPYQRSVSLFRYDDRIYSAIGMVLFL